MRGRGGEKKGEREKRKEGEIEREERREGERRARE